MAVVLTSGGFVSVRSQDVSKVPGIVVSMDNPLTDRRPTPVSGGGSGGGSSSPRPTPVSGGGSSLPMTTLATPTISTSAIAQQQKIAQFYIKQREELNKIQQGQIEIQFIKL
jgi:hypothetical protein